MIFKNKLREAIKSYFKDNYVHCEECGVVVKKEMAYKVLEERVHFAIFFNEQIFEEEKFYCNQHKKPYDRIELENDPYTIWSKKERKYYKTNIEVNEEGKVIK